MASKKGESNGTEHLEQTHEVHETTIISEKNAATNVRQVQTASVALAAATAAQNPSLLSKNMLKLYFIMGVGYLVSTMNGFGTP